MAEPRDQFSVLLVVAAFSRYEEALSWGRERLERAYGPIGLTSTAFVFNQTTYYAATMGTDLRKQFFAFRDLVAPDTLPQLKRETNSMENDLASQRRFAEPRPLNLDPGHLSLGKFLLATTKDQAHRVYLRDGIFSEVTLRYESGAFEPWPWTYADYRQECVRSFLREARDYYRERLRES
jgi:hypothetical protein